MFLLNILVLKGCLVNLHIFIVNCVRYNSNNSPLVELHLNTSFVSLSLCFRRCEIQDLFSLRFWFFILNKCTNLKCKSSSLQPLTNFLQKYPYILPLLQPLTNFLLNNDPNWFQYKTYLERRVWSQNIRHFSNCSQLFPKVNIKCVSVINKRGRVGINADD